MSEEITGQTLVEVPQEPPIQYFMRTVRRRGKKAYKMVYKSRYPDKWIYEFWTENDPAQGFRHSGQYTWARRHRRNARLKPITEAEAMVIVL